MNIHLSVILNNGNNLLLRNLIFYNQCMNVTGEMIAECFIKGLTMALFTGLI